jgi:hypothetical protein
MKEEKKGRHEGYVSFDPDELKNATQQGDPNAEAYEFLWEATCVSSHVDDVDKAAGRTDEDNIYPTTPEEVDAMEDLVNKAEAALKEPDAEFTERVGELRGIIEWSRERHWKLNWRVVVGVIISVFLLHIIVDSRDGDVQKELNRVQQVENWEEMPLTRFNIDSLGQTKYVFPKDEYVTIKVWHEQAQREAAWEYYSAKVSIPQNEAELQKSDLSETLKEFYENQLKMNKKRLKENLEKFETLHEASFKKLQKMALAELDEEVDEAKSAKRFVMFWNIFFILLIPVYIFAARPYGYTISRHRREAANLGKLEKIGLWLSGGLLAAGAGIGFVDVVTKWSDGSETRSDDGTGPARLAIKVGLFALAVVVFCCVSCFLMLYATITGLIRNYDWSEVKGKVASASQAAKAKYEEVKNQKK